MARFIKKVQTKIEIITDKHTLVIGLRDDRKFIITELIDRRNKKRMEAMQTRVGDSFTDEPLANSPLSSNRTDDTINLQISELKLQTNKEIIKHAKENGLSVKETKQLIQENEARQK